MTSYSDKLFFALQLLSYPDADRIAGRDNLVT